MRLVLLLGCLYVLLLSVTPCCLNDTCITGQAPQIEQAKPAGKDAIPCTDCSPFFSCGAYSGFVVTKTLAHSVVFYLQSSVQPCPTYLPPFDYEISQSIWQPPQLS